MSYLDFMSGSPTGGGGWGSAFGNAGGWDDVPDPFGGWGDSRDQDGDPATSSADDWRKIFNAGASVYGGGGGGYQSPQLVQPPQGMAPLQGLAPQYLLPLLDMYVEGTPHVPLHSGYGQRWG